MKVIMFKLNVCRYDSSVVIQHYKINKCSEHGTKLYRQNLITKCYNNRCTDKGFLRVIFLSSKHVFLDHLYSDHLV